MGKKQLTHAIIKWFENTNVDVDKILDHFGIPNKKATRDKFRQIAEEIRKERNNSGIE